jgi:uncharacterized repeat protein (TIGR03803 family)
VKSLPLRRLRKHLCLALAAGSFLAASTAGATGTFSTLYTFNSDSDGDVPYAALLQGVDGNFYGLNTTGGRSDNGTVFRIQPSGSGFTVLNTFTQSNQGNTPEGGLVQASDSNFYGVTSEGGANGFGTLYQVIPATGKLNTLFTFASGDPGSNPVGALVQGIDGYLYGTTEFGGEFSYGTVFRTDIATSATGTLAEIDGGTAGINPECDLIQAKDGNFYGTTSSGGADNLGTFFRVTPEGVFTTLYTFQGSTDGGNPLRGVIQGADGLFYGIANEGGTGGAGVIYQMTVSGNTATINPLYAFQPLLGDGTDPIGKLIQASDGNFYGTTSTGGANSDGTIFQVNIAGSFTTLYNFADDGDGGDPISGLTQGNNGKLYGTTAGETDSSGTIFVADLGLSVPAPQANLFRPASATAGTTIDIQGAHFVGASAVHFAAANGQTVAAKSFSVASGSFLSAVVPTGAVTGNISVTANGLTGTTPTELTITGTTPPPPPPPTETSLTIIAADPVAAFKGNNDGRFLITRSGSDISKRLTVLFAVGPNSTAVRGQDFEFSSQGEVLATVTQSVTIPAHERSVGLKVVPISTAAKSRPDKLVILNVRAGIGYKLGNPRKARVSIAGYNNG